MIPSFSYKILRAISAGLLLIICWHAISVHGLTESLVYCYESDGSMNIEATSDFSLGFANEKKIHADDDQHQHEGAEYHFVPESHRDVELSENCIKDIRTSRFDQSSVVEFLAFVNNSNEGFLPKSAFKQLHTFIPADIDYQAITSLKTVVLLN